MLLANKVLIMSILSSTWTMPCPMDCSRAACSSPFCFDFVDIEHAIQHKQGHGLRMSQSLCTHQPTVARRATCRMLRLWEVAAAGMSPLPT